MSEADPALAFADLRCDRFLPEHDRGPAEQLPLPIDWDGLHGGAVGAGTFIVGPSNRDAVCHLERFSHWTSPASILTGPAGSGRSTLAALFARASGGAVIDPLAEAAEDAVFHAWNRAHHDGTPLLVICAGDAEVRRVALPDLATRLATAPVVGIGQPDPDLAAALIERLLLLRGLHCDPDLGAYVAARVERSYSGLHAAVQAIAGSRRGLRNPVGKRHAGEALRTAGLVGTSRDETA